MLLNENKYDSDHDIEFLFERPIGWSSACLDSTIDYYVSYAENSIESTVKEKAIQLEKEK